MKHLNEFEEKLTSEHPKQHMVHLSKDGEI